MIKKNLKSILLIHPIFIQRNAVALKSDSWKGPYNWTRFRGSEDDVVIILFIGINHMKLKHPLSNGGGNGLPFEAVSRARRELFFLLMKSV